jgi:[ribosomal protein S18]-alanine N-acetyltransferase
MTPAEMAAIHALCFTTPRPWTTPEITAFQIDPLCFTLVESESFLIGRAVAGEAELLTIAVAPQARRRGNARKLMQRFLYQARLRSAEIAFLEVAATNTPAIALYIAFGFARTGLRPQYYHPPGQPPVDAILMARALG